MQSVVLIACPVTNDLVSTGIRARTLEELEPLNSLVVCESCGQDHEWTREDAVISVTTGAA